MTKRKIKKGDKSRKMPKAVIRERKVREVKRLYRLKYNMREIADRLDMGHTTVFFIIRGRKK